MEYDLYRRRSDGRFMTVYRMIEDIIVLELVVYWNSVVVDSDFASLYCPYLYVREVMIDGRSRLVSGR